MTQPTAKLSYKALKEAIAEAVFQDLQTNGLPGLHNVDAASSGITNVKVEHSKKLAAEITVTTEHIGTRHYTLRIEEHW